MLNKTISDFVREGDKKMRAIIIIGKEEITIDLANSVQSLPNHAKQLGIKAFRVNVKASVILAIVRHYRSHQQIHPSHQHVLEEII